MGEGLGSEIVGPLPSPLLPAPKGQTTSRPGPLCHSGEGAHPRHLSQSQLQSVENQESVSLVGLSTWKGADLKIKC